MTTPVTEPYLAPSPQRLDNTASAEVITTFTNMTAPTSPRDERVSLSPLDGDVALRGLLATREIEADPEQAARLDDARMHSREGAVRWVEDEDNLGTDSE